MSSAASEDEEEATTSDEEDEEAVAQQRVAAAVAAAAAAVAAGQLDPLLVAFDTGGRSSLDRFTKADFDRALGAHLTGLLLLKRPPEVEATAIDEEQRLRMLALLAASPAWALPYEFAQLFDSAERRRLCDLRATVCLDYYLERFAPVFADLPICVRIDTCAICYRERLLVRRRRCCRILVCAGCLADCVRVALAEGRPQIACPNCMAAVRRDEVRLHLVGGDRDSAALRRHEQLLTDWRRDPGVKTCPACGHVCRNRGGSEAEVVCEACGHPWCFRCHGPRHPGRRCQDPSADPDRRLLKAWSRRMHPEDQSSGNLETRTARNCPECHALIERNSGCFHVTCAICRTRFCYLCGKKYYQNGHYLGLLPKRLLGSHVNSLSIFGCSTSLLPDQPRLRRAVRRGVLALAVGGVAVCGLAVSPLLLLASPVWAPLLAARRRRRRRLLEHDVDSVAVAPSGPAASHPDLNPPRDST